MVTEQMRQELADVKGMDMLLGYLRNGRGPQSAEQVQRAFRERGATAMGLSVEQAEAAIEWAKGGAR